MEAGDGAAGDGDEQEGPDHAEGLFTAGEMEAGHEQAFAGETGGGGGDDEEGHAAIEEEGIDEIAGLKDGPDREGGGQDDVDGEQGHPDDGGQGERMGQAEGEGGDADGDGQGHHGTHGAAAAGDEPADEGGAQGDDDEGGGGDAADFGAMHAVVADEDVKEGLGVVDVQVREGDEGGEGGGAEAEEGGGEQEEHDDGEGDDEEEAGAAHGAVGDLGHGLTAFAHADEEAAVVLDGADEDGAEDDPEPDGEVAVDEGDGGADDGAGAGDGGEVVAEDEGGFAGDVVDAVLEGDGWGGFLAAAAEDALEIAGIEAIAQQEDGEGEAGEPENIHGEVLIMGSMGRGEGSGDGEERPARSARGAYSGKIRR